MFTEITDFSPSAMHVIAGATNDGTRGTYGWPLTFSATRLSLSLASRDARQSITTRPPATDLIPMTHVPETFFFSYLGLFADRATRTSWQSVVVLTTCCQTSLSLAFLQVVWTPKFKDWRSSSIVVNQVVLGPGWLTGLLQSAGGLSAAAMTQWWSSSEAVQAETCQKPTT